MFIRNIINTFVYWSDRLGGQVFDRHSKNGGGGHLPTKIARMHMAGHLTNFSNTRVFFYKNKLYKNTQAKICTKIKNNLRKITRLKF